MYGSWRWNVVFGGLGFVFIFLLAFINNPWTVSLLRGFYALIAFSLIAFPIRFITGLFLGTVESISSNDPADHNQINTGSNVDYVTPDTDEDLNEILKSQLKNNEASPLMETQQNEKQEKAELFQPLRPTKLVSTDNIPTEEITKAVRHLTGE